MTLVNIFNPQVVVIGGGVSEAGELLLEPARRIVRAARAGARGATWCGSRRRRSAPTPGWSAPRSRPRGPDGVPAGRRRAPRRLRMSGRLVVCPTPIGNLEDVTLRVLAALRDADVVACEDTRRTRVLLERYGVQATLVSYHEHNERERAAELVERMRGGTVVALVSDAGMPLVSDPGYVLVQGCVAAGLAVEVLPGPSAALAALVASALPSDAWRFAGFLPRKRAALVEVLRVAGDGGGVRVAAPCGRLARRARLGRSRAAGGGLPRAHQGARGGRARDGRRAGGALRGRGRRAARWCW